MNINWTIVPTLFLSFVLYWFGKKAWRDSHDRMRRVTLVTVAVLIAIPGLLIATYYLHLFDDAVWFYQFRAFPLSELTAAGAGLLAGLLAGVAQGTRRAEALILTLLFLGTALPHLKPILAPVPTGEFQDRWTQDVCLQSTPSTCGPASVATLLRQGGIDLSEREIARRCFTYGGGTENWYLARLFRGEGFDVQFITRLPPSAPIPVPSIAGVTVAGVGHFIPILSATEGAITTGDPLVGLETRRIEDAYGHFQFTGFFMKINKRGEPADGATVSPMAGDPSAHP